MTTTFSHDVFADALNLEEQFYREGYNLGVSDGSKSGRIEGRMFGLERGYEKFVEMGKLNGKAVVWEARLSSHADAKDALRLDDGNARLNKHVTRLVSLTDAGSLSTENNEDAVSEFDDRIKDARAKATLVAKIIGEDGEDAAAGGEDANGDGKAVRVRRSGNAAGKGVAGRRTGEMEDFVGLPGKS